MKGRRQETQAEQDKLVNLSTPLFEHYHRYSTLSRVGIDRDITYARLGFAAWTVLVSLGAAVELAFLVAIIWSLVISTVK